ncbi:alkaline phosphatase family protein [Robbsia sp. Bb-Pol-6]|uniref:Alkaline phosphatase family protein n=1 Tax=Robbsia betulipollinis TaxID=2981849 RepID=A0ABT3ZRP2_9BURK|nr:alkaline phosphatase family protein [Robbsia betulipollinis]MCY0389233.1 alkaline phosphatase family protein [Robbsia betulipollinis]
MSIALLCAMQAACGGGSSAALTAQDAVSTATPIKHVVVIFGENIAFDHYFGTYPNATNPTGEPAFTALAGTPSLNNLTTALLTANPNSTNTLNGTGAANPFRLDRSQALTASQNHNYTPEQNAFDGLKMDLFPLYTGRTSASGGAGPFYTTGLVMGYYDGNTVTAMWNYAQHFALNDNSFDTQFGPSTPGALNLISGQTNGAVAAVGTATANALIADGQGAYTMIGDTDPAGDVCSSTTANASMSGRNIGDLLNAAHVSWGWFEGGFDLTATNANGTTGCARSSYSAVVGGYKADYVPHHQPFQYYASTANPKHVRPTSTALIGNSADAANHGYDINDFYAAINAGNFPSVSFLKAPAYQDAHAGNSDPLDEQTFVTTVVNFLQKQRDWKDTVVILAYDDSDGWYDHANHLVNPSFSTSDTLSGTSACGSGTPLAGLTGKPVNGRCGYGPRLPLLAISPYAKANYVDHTLTDQTSVLRFIEDNWLSGARIGQGSFDAIAGTIDNMFDFSGGGQTPKLFLDTGTGLATTTATVATTATSTTTTETTSGE